MQAPKSKPKEPIPSGTHRAICYMVVDLGTQEVQYPGKPPSLSRQLRLTWELPDVRMEFEDDNKQKVNKPKVIGNTYTYSTYEGANLFQHVSSWTGSCPSDFDFSSLIGKNCLLNVTHKKAQSGNIYAKVSAVIQVPGNTSDAVLENPAILYELDAKSKIFPESMMGDNYKWLREMIESSKEFHAADVLSDYRGDDPPPATEDDYNPEEDGAGSTDPNDDVPF